MYEQSGYILGISRGHNGGACLIKDGKIVFALEEERLTRQKYDGGPIATMLKVLEYTNKLDFIFIAHTQTMANTGGKIDYTGDQLYSGLARKLGLIERYEGDTTGKIFEHPQVIDISDKHHITHAACAFYRSGFESAVAVVVDGAGTETLAEYHGESLALWETETIMECSYPHNFKTLYKHQGTRGPCTSQIDFKASAKRIDVNAKNDDTFISVISDTAGITKIYEAVTEYCGFNGIEAGKTMGLFPYGKHNPKIPNFLTEGLAADLTNRNLFAPLYPHCAVFNAQVLGEEFCDGRDGASVDELTRMQSRRDAAYHVQKDTQAAVAKLIKVAVKLSGNKNVVLSGGYALNCVANYHYLKELKDEGINLYIEPVSNDAGTAIGAAMLQYYAGTQSAEPTFDRSVYLGPEYNYSIDEVESMVEKAGGQLKDATDEDVVELMTSKNIVALFQGRSENGPRALGNRTLLFDPTFEDGKDFVNLVKKREYFRPFAGSILQEDVHKWFDLRGMEDSPHMMYAVNCQPGVEEKIPAIIHVDGTCRIQTVTEEQNPIYHRIISKFKEKTGVPIVFNTSFNLGGHPLVETLEDAVNTLKDSDIEYLYLPEHGKLVTISNIKFV